MEENRLNQRFWVFESICSTRCQRWSEGSKISSRGDDSRFIMHHILIIIQLKWLLSFFVLFEYVDDVADAFVNLLVELADLAQFGQR